MSYPISDPLNHVSEQCLRDCYAWCPELADESPEKQIVHFTLGMAGEVGEVVELIKKWQGGRPGYDINDAKLRDRIAEEIVDVIQYAGDLAAYLKLDLDDALSKKRGLNAKRFLGAPFKDTKP